MKTRFVAPAMALVLSSLMLTGCGRTNAVVEAQAAPSVAPGPPPFSKATAAKIEEDAGTSFEPLDPNHRPPAISLGRAMQLAQQNFGGVVQGKRPAEAQYGLVTNNRSGTLQADRSLKPSTVRQAMWLLYYRDIEMAVSSNVERVNDPLVNHADFLVYVDATTGDVPAAESISKVRPAS